MARLSCPHCLQPVDASPLFRWGSRFVCPECRKPLKFSRGTNALGFVGSFCFFAMMWAIMGASTEQNRVLAMITGALWIALVASSYFFRRIEKAD